MPVVSKASRTALRYAPLGTLLTHLRLALVAAIPALVWAQKPPAATFDVTSVKPHPNAGRQDMRFPQWLPGGRFQSTMGLLQVIDIAFNLPLNPSPRISGAPAWTNSNEGIYDIDATGTFPAGIAGSARADRQRQMLRALLADRFKLIIRRETKELPVYSLVVAKGGPKLQKADIAEKDCPDASALPAAGMPDVCHVFSGGQGRGMHGRAVDMADLTNFIENWTQRPVIDNTGLIGLYRIETSAWRSIQAGPPPPEGAKAEDGRDFADIPTLFQVMAGLGLRLDSAKAPVDVYIVEHIERPSEN